MSVEGRGRIILINGTSSSGKTTIVRAIQAAAPDLWLEMGIDRFAYALPGRVQGRPTWPLLFRYVPTDEGRPGRFTIETTARGHRFVSAMHATAATIAAAGLNVIVDHVVLDPAWVEEMVRLWADVDVLSVGIHCPLDVILEREHAREDRTIGQAEAQFDVVHLWTTYDIEVDTSVEAPDEAAGRILGALERRAG